ncbi:MAG TPA: D-alanyl-D-alanine carboxypeptidase family protein [Candidatus Limnocylindrales bacterium]|nr:D-alanyl-D-alanine carboxypeptidase family protein [Candidatus Limnocylindrales bacterium]
MRSTGLVRAIAAAALLAGALFAAPVSVPPPVAAAGPLPECRLDDILTEPRGYDDWQHIQVDWILSLGSDYKPPDLVSIYGAGVTGGGLVRKVAFDDLKAMAAAAKKAGVPLGSVSAYRSYQQQVKLFNIYVKGYGFDDAVGFSARPGHSEHQTGLTIDFAAAGSTKFVNEKTATGKWLAKHGWEYGWLMSYPDGKTDLTCYDYEPWHYRYLGRELAKEIHDSGLTIREYLWANFTQVDPACVALPAPTLVTPGDPRSCAFAGATTEPTAIPPASAPPGSGLASPGASSPGGLPSDAPTAPPDTTNTGTSVGPAAIIGLVGAVVLVLIGIVALSRRRSPRR